MFGLLKYIPAVAAFQDVSNKVKEAGKEGRPWFLQRTVIGAIIALVSVLLSIQFGVKLSVNDVQMATDNIYQIVTVITSIYGAVLGIYGLVMKILKEVKSGQPPTAAV
jgi:hypothetical protein